MQGDGEEFVVDDDESGEEDEDDDEEDEVEPQAEGTPGRTCEGAYAWVKMLIRNEGLGLIMLEPPYAADAAPDAITLASVLAKKHLLLMGSTADRATKIFRGGRRMQMSWMGGGTSLGNALWARYFLPSAAAAVEYFDERRTMPGAAASFRATTRLSSCT